MAKIFATTSGQISEREKRNMERSRKIAAQGMVLLENDGKGSALGTFDNYMGRELYGLSGGGQFQLP